jgi:hypothetical protein
LRSTEEPVTGPRGSGEDASRKGPAPSFDTWRRLRIDIDNCLVVATATADILANPG